MTWRNLNYYEQLIKFQEFNLNRNVYRKNQRVASQKIRKKEYGKEKQFFTNLSFNFTGQ